MDLTESIAAKSDQQNYDDYLSETRTVTITDVTKGSAEQPVNVELAEYPGRPFRPNKTMRRVLVIAWGKDSAAYIGRRLTLFGNPGVIYGGKSVGGVEISHMSHIDKPLTVALTALYQQIRQIPGAYTDELKTAFTDRGAALKVTAAPEQTEGDAA